jgi:pimeloyl-ACP methyl ester carboxylesterase
MEAVLEIDRELGLGSYEDLAGFESCVVAVPPEVVLGIWAQTLTVPPEQLTAVSETLLPWITAPLLSLHGSQPPAGYQSWLTGLVPTAEIEVWDGMGHLLHLVNPARFAARVAPLLR